MIYLLFALAAVLLLGLIGLIWQLWTDYAQVGPEEEEREREIATLNDAQANRISDEQLTRPVDADSAWQTMLQRGASGQRRRRRPPRR